MPRVPASRGVLVQVAQACICYTGGIKTQAGRFHSKKPTPFGFFIWEVVILTLISAKFNSPYI